MKVTLKILLAAAVVLLVYMCYRSIQAPREYDAEKKFVIKRSSPA